MRMTNEYLSGLGLNEEQVEAIMEAHQDTVSALEAYKADAEKLPGVQKELDDLKAAGGNYWKTKYETVHTEFEAAKAAEAEREAYKCKEQAYRDLLQAAGIAQKYVDKVARVSRRDIEGLEIQEGKVRNPESVIRYIKSEWPEFLQRGGAM